MKFLTTVAALGLSAVVSGCATVDASAQKELVQIHDFAGKTKAQICGAARDWVALNFKDSKAVVEVYDLERGKLIGKGNMTLAGFAGTPQRIGFTMTADCKDGKFRSAWNDFTFMYQGTAYPLKEDSMNKLLSSSIAEAKRMDASMTAYIASGAKDF